MTLKNYRRSLSVYARFLAVVLVATAGFLFASYAHAGPPSPTAGAAKVVITDSNSAPVEGAAVLAECSGGQFTALGTTDANGIVEAVPGTDAGCPTGAGTISFRVTKTGYLTLTTAVQDSFVRTYETTIDPENAGTFDGQYNNTYPLTVDVVNPGNTDSYLAQYWTTNGSGVPEIPSGTPDFVTTTASISYHLLDGATPNPAVGSTYSARFSKTTNFSAGDYTFTVCSDDGERLYIDGAMIADNWVTRGRTCDTPTATLTAGSHVITLEYYQQGGGQSLDFSYGDTTVPASFIAGYESADTTPTPTNPGTANAAYVNAAIADGSYWTTALSTNDSGYDSQVFNLKPDLGGLTNPNLNVSWTGHGAVPDAKKVYLSIWNTVTSGWDSLASQHCSTDCTLSGTSAAASHKDGDGNVWVMAKADNSYVPPVISNVTDNTGLLPVQWDTDQNATSELAWDTVSHANFDDYTNHVSDSDLITNHSITPSVSDNNTQNWRGVTSSADGTKLAAIVACGDIWTSADSGGTWTDQTGAPTGQCWGSVSESADGNTIIAAVDATHLWQGSFDGSAWTWTDMSTISSNFPVSQNYFGTPTVAISGDGKKLIMAIYNAGVWTASYDTGTWTWTESSMGGGYWNSVASSYDGSRVVLAGYGDIWTGYFDGSAWAWTDQTGGSAPGTSNWTSVATSSDGTKVFAGQTYGSIWSGSFDGTNWNWSDTSSGGGWWYAVTSSDNGMKVAAGNNCGAIITSTDGGSTWSTSNSSGVHCWNGLASSSDGTKLAGSAQNADIFISPDSGMTWTSGTGTKWYYRVKSVNANGQSTISDEYNFNFASTNSCPFIFTWDGSKYKFVIDASNSGNLSIGLDPKLWDATPWYKDPNTNNGYPNPLSYTKIPVGSLVPKTDDSGTYYDIKTSTELYETNYYDKAALEVIDHDPGVGVYPDYRNNGQYHSIATNAPAPVSVTDEKGQDVKSMVAADDNTYWHSRLSASANDATYLTIKLTNDATTPANLKVLIKATKEGPLGGGKGSDKLQYENSSGQFVNVPTDKDIFVVTRAGAPHASRNLMNTYGVQYKVIDLSGLSIKDNTIRLVTTSTYRQWDVDWLAVDTSADNIGTVTEETPYYADLHQRGVSVMVKSNPSDPKMDGVIEPAYGQIAKTEGEGFPLTGKATRYGNVVPLLSAADDKFVIMTQGDELALKYAVPPLADGKVRDFAYYTLDYHKPQKYALGHTITPLPFNAMTSYPYHDTEHYPTDADHNAYQATYNTRVINWGTQQQNGNQIHHSLNTDAISVTGSNGDATPTPQVSGGISGGMGYGSKPVTVIPAVVPTSPTPGTGTASSRFTRNLKSGISGDDVAALQAYLENAGFAVGKPGKPGSKGHYTKTFGSATKAALKKFQKAHGIQATGTLGDKTRAYMNSH